MKMEMTCDEPWSENHCGCWNPRDKSKGRAYWTPAYDKKPPEVKWKYGRGKS